MNMGIRNLRVVMNGKDYSWDCFLREFTERIKDKMPVYKMASYLNISRQTLSDYLDGTRKPNFVILFQIADAIGVRIYPHN